jgi:hypothetical protein
MRLMLVVMILFAGYDSWSGSLRRAVSEGKVGTSGGVVHAQDDGSPPPPPPR